MRTMTNVEVMQVSGGTFTEGVNRTLDNAGRGALVGGTVGWLAGPQGAALGAAAGAVYGAGVGLIYSLGQKQ